MDIKNKNTLLHSNVKRFTLRATASAMLSLSAENVIATNPCPTYISSNLAGQICDLNQPNTVTVRNGGEIGGIVMSGQTPTPSYIQIDAGGEVNTTGISAIAININNHSTLSNGLTNNGSIRSANATGIQIASSTIYNGITNNGAISASSQGIWISGTSGGPGTPLSNTIHGDIFNSGTIVSSSATAITISYAEITGGISNSGTISGSNLDTGIEIRNHTIIGTDITNSGLINAYGGNALSVHSTCAIQGGVSNTGKIESITAVGLSIDNVSTVQGDIFNSGTISGNSKGLTIHNLSRVGKNIYNTGVISGGHIADTTSIYNNGGLSIYSQTTISGNIINNGIINGDICPGIVVSSASVIQGGIFNSGIIQGNTNAIHIASGNTVSQGINIIGQNARIIGNVDAVETDVNITKGAVFSSEGTYDVNTFNIAQNAVFNMANLMTVKNSLGFNNSGTLAISNTPQTIIGNYTQNKGGLFQTGVSNATTYGQLQLLVNSAVTGSGSADLSQSGDIYVQIDRNSSLHTGDVLYNVISGNTFLAPTSGFNVSDNSFIWNFIASLNNTNTGVNLTATVNPAAYQACQGAYCQGAANTIIGQVTAGNALFSPYAILPTASAFQTAASQATPELTNENNQMIQLITRAVVDIVPMWSSLRGKSAGDATLYQPGKIWVKPYGASLTQNKRNTVNGFDAAAYGAVIGKDIELSNDWLFGGAFAAGGDNMRGKAVLNGQSINSSAYQSILYGAKKFSNQTYFAGQGLVGYENNNTSRSIPLYATTAKSSYNSWFTNIRAEAGWSILAFSPNFVFTPAIDASYLFINQGNYQESGSPMDLSVATNNNSSLVLGVYGNGAYHLRSMKNQHDLTLTGYVGVAGNVLNSQPQTVSTFVASGPSFSTFGVQFNEPVFRGGVGLTLTSQTKPLIVELNYDIQAGNNAYSGIGAATIKYKL